MNEHWRQGHLNQQVNYIFQVCSLFLHITALGGFMVLVLTLDRLESGVSHCVNVNYRSMGDKNSGFGEKTTISS